MNATQTTTQHRATIACRNADTELYVAAIDGQPTTGGQHRRLVALAPEDRYVGEIALTEAQYDELMEIGRRDRMAVAFGRTSSTTRVVEVEDDDDLPQVVGEITERRRQTIGRHRKAFYAAAAGIAPAAELKDYFRTRRAAMEAADAQRKQDIADAEARIHAEAEAERKRAEQERAAAKARAAADTRTPVDVRRCDLAPYRPLIDGAAAKIKAEHEWPNERELACDNWARRAVDGEPFADLLVLDRLGEPAILRDCPHSDIAYELACRLKSKVSLAVAGVEYGTD